MRNTTILAAALLAVTATSAAAQGRGRNTNGVPPGQRPPDGMCRVWVRGVPPGQQSPVTDCATAEAQARITANSRVIYGGHPGRKGDNDRDEGLLTRRRQLADGSWVVDRYRRDANGNITIVSTKPLKSGDRKIRKERDKSEDREMKKERDRDDDQMKEERDRDKQEMKGDKDEMKQSLKIKGDRGDNGNRGGKGKGKH